MIDFKLTEEEQFLCHTIRHRDYLDKEAIIQLYESLGDEYLFGVCEHNRVTPIVADALIISCGRDNIPERWIKSYEDTNNRIASYMEELDRAASLLGEASIPLVALKNSGITRGLYPYYGASPMGDIDVLVRRDDFRRAHEILTQAGYMLKFRCPLEEDSIDAAERGGGAEYSVDLDNGEKLWFELQWRPVAGRWIRPDQEPNAEELVKRAVPVNGSKVMLLSPEDNLLQVCLHTAKHSYVRAPGFRLHTDVDRIVRSLDIDWDLFVTRVKALQTRTAVFFSLALAQSLLDTPVPQNVINRIRPGYIKTRVIKGWLERVGIFDPDGKKWGNMGFILFVSLLYDDVSGLTRGVFPSAEWMKKQYGFDSNIYLPYFHIKRIVNLAFRRVLG